jgi:hypothetical protein
MAWTAPPFSAASFCLWWCVAVWRCCYGTADARRQARDTFFGGALLLLPERGIVYLSAPSYTLYDLSFGRKGEDSAHEGAAHQRVYLLPHAYYLYQKAQTLLQSETNAASAAAAAGVPRSADNLALHTSAARVRGFCADCLLHMLLNDLARAAAMYDDDNGPPRNKERVDLVKKHLLRLLGSMLGVSPSLPTTTTEGGTRRRSWFGSWSSASKLPVPAEVPIRPQLNKSTSLLREWMVRMLLSSDCGMQTMI